MTREALIAIRNDLVMLDKAGNRTKEMQSIIDRCDSTLASLTEPFDPAKHLSGWVKEHDNYWNLYGKEGFFTLSRWDSVSDKWRISWQKSMSLGDSTLFHGEIKAASFFHALCGALNIK